jgi:integrase
VVFNRFERFISFKPPVLPVVADWRHRVFNKALEKAELRRVRIHDLRHTYATLRISKGDNIQDGVKTAWASLYQTDS